MFRQYRTEARSVINTIVELTWYMRGAIQYHDMMQMSYFERQVVGEFIEKRMDAIKKHQYPMY